jgi:hypothetical protein
MAVMSAATARIDAEYVMAAGQPIDRHERLHHA